MKKQLNVLVLGVGGNVSQGILKALALSSLNCRVIGACTSGQSLGLFTTDGSYLSPAADHESFVPWLIAVCLKENIHAVLSGVEPVLDVLLQHQTAIKSQSGAICITNSAESVAIGRDKLSTCEWLRDQGFNFPAFAATEDATGISALLQQKGFPLIAKPRSGKGSSGIHLINDQAHLDQVRQLPGYVVQESLGSEESEYTASSFSDSNGQVRGIIVLHRQLQHGTTVSATAGHFPEIRAEVERIAKALRPEGPCNIQLRIHQGKPTCFELNVRFSGTTPMRARFGFNDVESTLRHYVLGESAKDLPVVTSGSVIRYWNEVYVAPEAIGQMETNSALPDPKSYPLTLEDYSQRL